MPKNFRFKASFKKFGVLHENDIFGGRNKSTEKKPLKQFFRHGLHAFKHFPVNFGIKIIVIKLPFFWYYFYMIIEAQF